MHVRISTAALLSFLVGLVYAEAAEGPVGRPVRVVSVAIFNQGIEKTAQVVDREAAAGADLVLLTEVWTGEEALPNLDAPAITTLAALARKHQTYIVSPVRRKDGKTVYNSAVLLDRQGKIAGIYNKVYPVLPDPPGVGGEDALPGNDAPVFETDFGRIGMTICFDAQFPEVWQRLADQGAQLVLFASAYSAGRSLGAYATLHHYYIVSSIRNGECQAYDITGEKLLDEVKGVSRITLDLDRRIFHDNDSYNYRGQRDKLLKENPGVAIDKTLQREGWYVLKAVRPGVDLPALVKRYDLQELRDFLNKQRRQADHLRGYRFKRIGPEGGSAQRPSGPFCLTAFAPAPAEHSSAAGAAADQLAAWWSFDEESGRAVCDGAGGKEGQIVGNFRRVAGVRGGGLKFDGFTTHVIRSAKDTPPLQGAFTIEAWLAPQTYPWGWCTIVAQQADGPAGYSLRLDAQGHLGLAVAVDGQWRQCTSEATLPLMQWSHVAATFDPRQGIRLYLNGKPAGQLAVRGPLTPAPDADLWIGQNQKKEPCQFHSKYMQLEDKQVPVYCSLDGILDEVKIVGCCLSGEEIERAFAALKPAGPRIFGGHTPILTF